MTDLRALAASAVVVACAAGLAACKSDAKPAGVTAAAPVAIDVAAVNALVPAALQDTLVFERREIAIERGSHKTTYAIAAPSGWLQPTEMFALLRPKGGFRGAPYFDVRANCEGPCKPKAWGAIADRVTFAPRTKGKIIKDARAPGRRTTITEVESAGVRTTDVVVAWWADGDTRYHVCSALLDDELKDAAPAFDKACQAVAITGDE
jgi:hypothetical protein